MPTRHPKKLIEIDLPLDVINRESAREKSIRHGHPSTLHLWWARRPLAACRAVIFASMVDDPKSLPDEFQSEEEQLAERRRLHRVIERLVKWEATDESQPESRALLNEARYEIARSVARSRGDDPPADDDPNAVLRYLGEAALPIYDPFAGGGSIPLEAQRLGLRAVASDLNPVAVLINKALIEIPPKFAAKPPANPDADPLGMKTGKMIGRGKNRRPQTVEWSGAAGLADDIRYYGRKMREMAFDKIGRLYPKAKLPDGSEAAVIAWLWARTVPCPNPTCRADMPLMKTFHLSRKPNNRHWIKPVVNRDADGTSVSFEVQNHDGGVPDGGTVGRSGANCVACDASVPLSYVRERARAGDMREKMTAVVAEGKGKRLFFSPTDEHVKAARAAEPKWRPSGRLPERALSIRVQNYGFTEWHTLFTKRQLTALTTFGDLASEVRALIIKDGASDEYADAIRTYLALAVGRLADACSNCSTWQNVGDKVAHVFTRQGIAVVWDFAEVNPFSASTQNWMGQVNWVSRVLERMPTHTNAGQAQQADAATTIYADSGPVIVTDPPYYSNIHYADSSDFFYVWLRHLLRDIYPNLFSGILTPKNEEMVANQFRFESPRDRFESMMNKTLRLIRERATPEFPSSIFYAYKQREEVRDGITSTGWDTMLTALVNADFRIVGTWPMRTERLIGLKKNVNALASSVVLVCRPRDADAPIATRREFVEALARDLPEALDHLTREGHIAPVDLAQAAIGPGMEIYSRYSSVETIAGEPVPVREALIEINRALAFYHRREQGDLDPESRFCMDWLRQVGFADASFGEAEVLSQALNVSVESMASLGLLAADAGRVRLLPMDRYAHDERPMPPGRMTAWEGCLRMAHHMSDELGGGVTGCARVLLAMDGNGASAERLARILYDYHDSKGDSASAVIFNDIAVLWQSIEAEARRLSEEESQAPLMQ